MIFRCIYFTCITNWNEKLEEQGCNNEVKSVSNDADEDDLLGMGYGSDVSMDGDDDRRGFSGVSCNSHGRCI